MLNKRPHRLFRGSASYALHSLRNAFGAATAPDPNLQVSSNAVKFYLVKKKPSGRSRRTSIFSLTAFQNLFKKCSILSHPLKMNQCTSYGPHHLPQKGIGFNLKNQIIPLIKKMGIVNIPAHRNTLVSRCGKS